MAESAVNDKDLEPKEAKNGEQNGEEDKDKTKETAKEMRAVVLTGFGGQYIIHTLWGHNTPFGGNV